MAPVTLAVARKAAGRSPNLREESGPVTAEQGANPLAHQAAQVQSFLVGRAAAPVARLEAERREEKETLPQ